jgi:hypothetical protein
LQCTNYQKKDQINDLNNTIISERNLMRKILLNDNTNLEDKINDLVNLGKYKKLNEDLKDENSGIKYIKHKILDNKIDAERLSKLRKYNKLKKEQAKINNEIKKLKESNFTKNAIIKYKLENKSLKQQIESLEKYFKDRFQNKVEISNNLNILYANKDLQSVFPKYNHFKQPISNKIIIIKNKLENLNKRYSRPQRKHDIQLHKQLLSKIQKVKYELSNNMKYAEPDVPNIKKALQNLENEKYKNIKVYTPNTKRVLEKLSLNNQPIKTQINKLQDKLKRDRQLKNKLKNLIKRYSKPQGKHDIQLHKQLLSKMKKVKYDISNNIKPVKLEVPNIKRALQNLEKEKYKNIRIYTPNTKRVLEKLNLNNEPIKIQINKLQEKLKKYRQLKNKLKDLEKQMAQNTIDNRPAKNQNKQLLSKIQKVKYDISNNIKPAKLEVQNIKRALQDLKKDKQLKNKLKNLEKQMAQNKINNRPDQNKNKELLSQMQEVKDDISNNIKPAKLEVPNMKKALQHLEKEKDKKIKVYIPNTKRVLEKLNLNNKPIETQINKLKKDEQLKNKLKDSEKQMAQNKINNRADQNKNKELLSQIQEVKDDISNNINPAKLEVPNMKKALQHLEKEKDKKIKVYIPNTKRVLEKLNLNNEPIETQINKLQDKLKKDEQLKNKLKDLEKQMAQNKINNRPAKNPKKDYINKLQQALVVLEKIKKLEKDSKSNNSIKPVINVNIENTIQYLENKQNDLELKPTKLVQLTLDKFNIKDDEPTNKQLSKLYKYLYFVPSNNANISKLNFIINMLEKEKMLQDKLNNINIFLDNNKPLENKSVINTNSMNDQEVINTIMNLKNEVKNLEKLLEKNNEIYRSKIKDKAFQSCWTSEVGNQSVDLFTLYLKDNYIDVKVGSNADSQKLLKELGSTIPNIDSLIDKTMTLKEFMRLTKPIYEKSVEDKCRYVVYFIDKTISKRAYKRKTLIIQNHFFKHIDGIFKIK